MGRTTTSGSGQPSEASASRTPIIEGTPRELKFKVPSEFQRKLYGLKIVTGKNLSQLVTEAVGAYLSDLEGAEGYDPTTLLAAVESQLGSTA